MATFAQNTLGGPGPDIMSIIAELLQQRGPQARTGAPQLQSETLEGPRRLVPDALPTAGELFSGIRDAGIVPNAPATLTGAPTRAPLRPPRLPSAENLMAGIEALGQLPPEAAPNAEIPPFTTETQREGQISPEMQALIDANPNPPPGPATTQSIRPPPMAPRSSQAALRQPGLFDYVDTALAGMAGGRPVLSTLGDRFDARNATHDALIARNVTPELARAMTLNPQMLSTLLPSIFSPRTQVVNNRLVDSQSGRVIADLSDRFSPLPEGSGVLNTATGQATGGGLPKPPAGFEWVNPQDRGAGLRAIPGGPGTHISSEVAGRLALMRTAKQGVRDARGVYERAWGMVDFGRQGAANIPLVGDLAVASGDQGIAQRNIRTAVEAALRTMTGAAAPETEVTRYTSLFTPGARDTVESAKQKLDALDAFMTEADNLATQGRTSNPPATSGSGIRTYNPTTGRLE